jgi:hypothetical protein
MKYTVTFIRKTGRKEATKKTRRGWEDNSKMDLKEVG